MTLNTKPSNDNYSITKLSMSTSTSFLFSISLWFKSEMISCPNVLDNGLYEQTEDSHNVIFVNDLFRKKIYQDFF